VSFRKCRYRINRFISERRLPTDLKRFPGRDRHPQPAGQRRPHRRGIQPLQRQSSKPPSLCWPGRDRRRLVEALRGRSRLSLAQARRSLLQRSDLREPVRRRGRRRLHPAVVAAPQERRVSSLPTAPPEQSGGAFDVTGAAFGRAATTRNPQWPAHGKDDLDVSHGPIK